MSSTTPTVSVTATTSAMPSNRRWIAARRRMTDLSERGLRETSSADGSVAGSIPTTAGSSGLEPTASPWSVSLAASC